MAQRWKNTITNYLIDMDVASATLEAITPFPTKFAMALARATLNINVTSMSLLQAHDVQRQLGKVDGSC